jgi:hypothetical protein
MSDVLRFVGPIGELRFDSGSRMLSGRAMPYGETVRIGGPGAYGFDERFVHGAFARSISERVRAGKVKLFGQHGRTQGHLPIGRVIGAREEPSGLYIEARVADTTPGRDAVELIRTGVAEGLSVSFRSVKEREVRGVREVTEAVLLEVSVVDEPAYPGAKVLSLRSRSEELDALELGTSYPATPGSGCSVLLADRELELLEML